MAAAVEIIAGWVQAQNEGSLNFYVWARARNTLTGRIALALATTRRDAFAAGVEASAAHVETLESGMHRLRYAAAIRDLKEPK